MNGPLHKTLGAAVELAWQQWTALGVRGVAPIPRYAIDLEALIAFTPFVAEADPRLAEEVRDWCMRIAPGFVSAPRLKHVTRLFPPIRDKHDVTRSSPTATSGKSAEPRLSLPALFQLRARRIFGVGSRADTIVALLRSRHRAEGVSVRDLAAHGYTKRNVARVLDELAGAGVVTRLTNGHAGYYRIDPNILAWIGRFPVPREIPPWVERLAIVAAILDACHRMKWKAEIALAVELNQAFARLEPLTMAVESPRPRAIGAEAIIEAAARWVDPWLPAVPR